MSIYSWTIHSHSVAVKTVAIKGLPILTSQYDVHKSILFRESSREKGLRYTNWNSYKTLMVNKDYTKITRAFIAQSCRLSITFLGLI